MNRVQTLLSVVLAAALVLFLTARDHDGSPAASAWPDETPPGISAGQKLYWVQTRAPSLQALASTTPVEIIETRGSWCLIDSNGINFGPIWLNFDQVLHYKTKL